MAVVLPPGSVGCCMVISIKKTGVLRVGSLGRAGLSVVG